METTKAKVVGPQDGKAGFLAAGAVVLLAKAKT